MKMAPKRKDKRMNDVSVYQFYVILESGNTHEKTFYFVLRSSKIMQLDIDFNWVTRITCGGENDDELILTQIHAMNFFLIQFPRKKLIGI